MIFKVCIQGTEINRCVFAVVFKPCLLKSRKEIFEEKYKHLTNSGKSLSKTKNKRILQTTLLWGRSPKTVKAVFILRELEMRLFWELHFDILE